MSKAITARVSTSKVITALEKKLVKIKDDKANQKVNEERFSKEQEKHNKEVAKLALSKIAKATDLSAHTRYNGEIQVSFSLPAGTIDLPKEPQKDFDTLNDWQYKEMVEEIENALNIFRMTDDEYVNASTMKGIAKYL